MVVTPMLLRFEVLLTRSALAALGMVLAWTLVVLLAIGAEALTRGRIRVALALGCPRLVHRWLLGVLGGAVLLGAFAAPATATTSPGSAARAVVQGSGSLDGLPLPDRPGSIPAAGTAARGQRDQTPHPGSSRVRVHEGQSLWGISRALLPDQARTRSVAALTRTLYRHNRTLIGKDPDLIRPGQHLVVPSTVDPSSSEDS